MISVNSLSKYFYGLKGTRKNIPDTGNTALSFPYSLFPLQLFPAISEISFELPHGEFLGIVGSNASGKSTLLKLLAGIYPPTSGGYKIDGSVLPFLELGTGFNGELTGRENVYLNGALLGLKRGKVKSKFNDIVAFAEAGDFIDLKLKYYSTGMQMRLGFAIAAQTDPDVILMDEIFAVGDVRFQRKCFDLFREFVSKGKTIILVSHDLLTIRRHCNRALYLREGKLRAFDDAKKVVDLYITEYVDDCAETTALADGEETSPKSVSIEKIEFLDETGERKNIFSTGEAVTIMISIVSTIAVDFPNLVLTFRDDVDNYLFGSSNDMRHERIKKIIPGGNVYTILIPQLPFLEGKYYVGVAVGNRYNSDYYDWKEKIGSFSVRKNISSNGIFNVEYHHL